MRKAFFQLHVAVFLAGFTGILGRLITLNEGLLVWYRLLISSATMWIVFSITRRIQRISFADVLKVSGTGLIAALHWVTFYGSIKKANVSVALVCFSAIGFFTALIEPLIARRKIILSEVLLGLLVMAGIYIIFHFDPSYKTGIILGILSALLGSIFPICNRLLLQRMNTETLVTYELTGGWLMLSLLLPFYLRGVTAASFWPGWMDWMWLLLLSWVCSVWAFQLSARALQKVSAFTVNVSYNLEPVYGILLAFIVFGENKDLHLSFYLGLSLIVLAVSFQTWRVYRQRNRKVA